LSDKLLKTFTMLTGAAVTVSVFNFANVGASDDISLQSPEKSITAAELHSSEGIPSVVVPVSVSYQDNKAIKNEQLIEDNTFIITSDPDDLQGELLDESSFTYDGNHFWISATSANLRSESNVSSDIVSCVDYGTDVIRVSYGTLWSKVRLDDGTEGFILSSLLTDQEIIIEETEEETAETVEAQTAETTQPTETEAASNVSETALDDTVYASCDLNVRTGPGIDYSLVKVLAMGDEIDVVAITDNGWYKTAVGNYVKAELCCDEAPSVPSTNNNTNTDVDDDDEDDTSDTSDSTDTSSSESSSSSSVSDLASYCEQFIGTPYVYGGASPSGFDCSGFVSYVMANYYGVTLPHDAAGIAEMGSSVSLDSLQTGDVLCHDYNDDGYIDHVSLYVGGGTIVHASDSRQGVISTTWFSNVTTVRRFV